MIFSIYSFIRIRILTDWRIKIFHSFLVVVAIYWLIGGFENEIFAFTQSIPGVRDTLNTSFPRYTLGQIQLLVGTGVFLIISFNLSYILKNWTWDVITQYAPVTVLNIFMFYGMLNTDLVPITELNNLLLANAVFTSSVRLSRADKDQKFVSEVFGRYVNPTLLETILARRKMPQMSGELREMTVLFCDIRGFTTLSESLAPKRLLEILNKYFDTMGSIVINNKGTIDKYIGDSIMAFWNAPIQNRNHASNGLAAAMKMSEEISQVRNSISELKNINIGIGLTTGNMIIGSVGGHDRYDYTVLGDSVNLASRLEGLTKRYGVSIIVNEKLASQAQDKKTIFRFLDEIIVKGKTQPVKIYEPMINNIENQTISRAYIEAYKLSQNNQKDAALNIFKQLTKQFNDSPSQLMIERLESKSYSQNQSRAFQWNTK